MTEPGKNASKGRGPGKPFGPGNTPRGRPPLTDAQRLARTMRAQCQPELVESLLEIVRTSADAKDRIAAAKALLEELPTEVAVSSVDGPAPTVAQVLAGLAVAVKRKDP